MNGDTTAMVVWLLLVVVIVLTPAGVTAYLARAKGLNPWAWFAFGLVLSWAPLFMVVAKRRGENPLRKVWCDGCGAAQRIPQQSRSFPCAMRARDRTVGSVIVESGWRGVQLRLKGSRKACADGSRMLLWCGGIRR